MELNNLVEEHFRQPHKYDNRKMKVIVKSQKSILSNDNIKWHLPDEMLWITKYEYYADIENSIANSVGSFNWLYEINDTVLFDKDTGRFETAIIDLSGKICIGDLKIEISAGDEQKGDLFFVEGKNCDFEFPSSVIYAECVDYLVAFPKDAGKQEYIILYIVDDFGFIVINDQLEGWILKNASKHICMGQGSGDDIDRTLLARYLNALKLWEEDDPTEIESFLGIIEAREDSFSVVLKNCLTKLL